MTRRTPTNRTPQTRAGGQVTELEDGAALLDQVAGQLRRYVVLQPADAVAAVVLWVAATHGAPAWNAAPRLVIKAPEKRCGKSRLLDLIEAMSHNPIMTTNASPAAVYRSIGADPDEPPTLLIDEADTMFGPKAAEQHEELRGLLNAGHQRGRPTIRWDAGTRRLDRIETFALAALAGIGNLPDTIEDRAVIVCIRRRAPDEQVSPYRARRDGPALHHLKGRLNQWVRPQLDQLGAAAPAMPVEDRAADTWEPLVAIADAAGGHWPATARTAILTLTGTQNTKDTVTLRVRLLMDCRTVIGDTKIIPAAELLRRLKADDEAPWADLGGEGLKPRKLGLMLGEFDIRARNHRWDIGGQTRGYERADFTDAWNRYCPPDPTPPGSRPIHPKHPTPSHTGDASDPWDASCVPDQQCITGLTSPGTHGTQGTQPAPAPEPGRPPAVCISCRTPLSYDDGSHTHPTCNGA